MTHLLHATSVVFCGKGILLRGAAGAGKSDLALRIMEAGGGLISDDQTELHVEAGALFASPPKTIAGLMEIRGVGLKRVPYVEKTKIELCLDCVPLKQIPRLPDAAEVTLHSVTLSLFKIYALEASAVAKIRAILHTPFAHD